MIICRTPLRVSFFGGGTDYPTWFSEHGGGFLSATVTRYCYVMCRHLPPFFDVRSRITWSIVENISAIDEIKNPVVREVLRFLKLEPSFDIHYHGDLPARTGLGSSSAFAVGLLNALHALRGEFASKSDLAREAITVERDLIGDTVGVQDQFATAFGGLNFANIDTDGSFSVRPVAVTRQRTKELEDHLLLIFTGISRSASSVADSQVKAMPDHVAEMRRVRALVDEAHAVLREHKDIREFGKLLHETWQIKRSLSRQITTDLIDDAYRAALNAGAIGGKLLGAGGGGFLLIFAEPHVHEQIRAALRNLLFVPIQFEFQGSQIIYHEPDQ
jgi:D-glycero-alpha-D-manno-heptose-7-phosphate kinase